MHQGPEPLVDIKVLLIDDDNDDYIITKKMFSQIDNSPFELERVDSYEAGIKCIDEARHDIYLIDFRLGAHTGLDILEYANPSERDQPFILLTGVSDSDIEWKSLKLAAADYLEKGSFDAKELSRTLTYGLQRKRLEPVSYTH